MSIPLPFPNINDTDINDVQTWSSSKILDYLKPALETVVTKTVEETGAEVTFNDVDPDTCEITKVGIEILPSQQGSGDPSPSNPRPLNSFSSLKIEHTGKNIIPSSNVCVTVSRNDLVFDKAILVKKGVTYSCSISNVRNATNWRFAFRFYDGQGNNIINAITNGYVTFTPALADTYDSGKTVMQGAVSTTTSLKMEILKDCYVTVGITSGDISESTTLDYQLEVGSTPSNYAAYVTDPHTLDLGSTVYGVTGDCATGEFEETWKAVKISSLNWTYQSNNTRFYTADLASLIAKPATSGEKSNLLCDVYKTVSFSAFSNNNEITVATSGNIFLRDTNYNTKEAFIEDMGDYYLCYPLATPAAITATPITSDLFEGTNVLGCAPAGTVDIEITCTDTIGNILKKEGIL